MRRFGLLYVAPTLLLLTAAMLPLVLGTRTLYVRDVLTSHYPLKASQAESLRRGELPLIDRYRAGGQPLVGNPNAVPLYPDNALYLVASPLWALNAHFWLHLLIAPAACFWLGRAWGLSRPAAWAAGVCYAGSGFLFSQLNLYNLVAGAALAPAFLAACLVAWDGARQRLASVAVGLLWALLLLAGDPFFAALSLVLAATAGFTRHHRRPQEPLLLVAAVVLGSALAAPMLVEFLRILPLSYRGYWSYSPQAMLAQSWDPRSLIEWFLPLFFGGPDFGFWGQRFYGGNPPLYYSLSPGLLGFGLVLVSGRPRGRAGWWAWAVVASGAFVALGAWNPLMRLLYGLPGASVLRYPIKVWLAVAVGGALLCGLGFERLLEGDRRRRLALFLGTAAILALGAGCFLILAPSASAGLRVLEPQRLAGVAFDHERLRWAGLCLMTLVIAGLLALALLLTRNHRPLGGALLLAVHLAGQCFFLQPLYDSDDLDHYVEPPSLLAAVPEDAVVVHGGFHDLFGPQPLSALPEFPDARTLWLARSHFAQLYPFSGIPWGRRYEFNNSPEGLDSFFSISLARAMKLMPDAARVRVLAASGVDVLLLDRELAAAAGELVRLRARVPRVGGELFVYELERPAAPVALATTVHRVPQMNAALAVLTDPAFDPRTMVVLPGPAAIVERGRSGAQVEVLSDTTEELEVAVESADGGFLVVQRAYLAIYRAAVDGEPAAPETANFHRLAVEVPAGEHRVRLWVDRRPTRAAWLVAVLGIAGLVLLEARPKTPSHTRFPGPPPPGPLSQTGPPPARERGRMRGKDRAVASGQGRGRPLSRGEGGPVSERGSRGEGSGGGPAHA